MSEQEKEAFAARLTRIWRVDGAGLAYEPFDHLFFGRLVGGAKFSCWLVPETSKPCPYAVTIRAVAGAGRLDYLDGAIYEDCDASEKEFAQSWMPLFRRGCWLSGCPLEVSAHEKAQWVQDFTQGEIRAWNLLV